MKKSANCGLWRRRHHRPRKKTEETIQTEITREVGQFLRIVFATQRKAQDLSSGDGTAFGTASVTQHLSATRRAARRRRDPASELSGGWFVEPAANFPEARRYVLETLGGVYKYDADAREGNFPRRTVYCFISSTANLL